MIIAEVVQEETGGEVEGAGYTVREVVAEAIVIGHRNARSSAHVK